MVISTGAKESATESWRHAHYRRSPWNCTSSDVTLKLPIVFGVT